MTHSSNGWTPVCGSETDSLFASLPFAADEAARAAIKAEALDVLRQCAAPGDPNRRTGLVLGYVQSGKTLSYITLCSLARENKFPLIIVMTGTSVPLFEQATSELRELLQASGRHYLFLENASVDSATVLQTTIDTWRNPNPDLPRQTAILPVMKHVGRIDHVTELLEELELAGIGAIVIDDEADQASLNTRVRQDEVSATYDSIRRLRAALPSHTYLQYTATPQALLLLSIVDQLSPRFVKVLNPGNGYVGGRDFFGSETSQFVGIIPDDDIPSPTNAIPAAPESLMDALARFFIGVADGYVQKETMGTKNRSMMIHPSRLVEDHADYYAWVFEVVQSWPEILNAGSSREREALLERFRVAHADIARTREELAPFSKMEPLLSFAISQTLVHRVNAASGRTPSINWNNRYAHILVGGQAMDRGFVVRGLTVTYMPRGRGVGNADTIQQRARFFGYKADIKGYCRVYLESNIFRAMVAYVRHEEHIRQSLLQLEEQGVPLTAWRRTFILTELMNLTRSNVYDMPVVRVATATTGWNWPRFAYITEDTVRDNREVFKNFRSANQANKTAKAWGHDHYENVPIEVILDLVTDYRTATPNDTVRFSAARDRLETIMTRTNDAVADVYDMIGGERRFRAGTHGKGIEQIFQGRSATANYPGDRSVVTEDRVTVQLHEVEVRFDGVSNGEKVPVLAIRFPQGQGEDVSREVLVQFENHE